MAGTEEQPMQPCPDWDTTQQGSDPAQQAVNGAAIAPSPIQASSAMATKRAKVTRKDGMQQSLA